MTERASKEPASEPKVSQLLARIRQGEHAASDQLFCVVQKQLRKLATNLLQSEPPDNNYEVTALVNEACLRLFEQRAPEKLENRRHLFGAATRAMQQVLTDHARARNTQKRGAGMQRQSLDVVLDRFESKHKIQFEDLEEALARLKADSPRQHEVLTLRFFAGLTIADAAKLLNCSESTVESDWRLARAKLHAWLREAED